ncbi:MAG: hypothetical protein COW30_00215 [Rhodospirillales bacterium CG15_BIG_FIL_POST_REV_8_21_14_020_66_15]|nr:MAG: hypothetical protein COW30_00215 [Rhodospirillales bacterium CG15_BIG_FIL_POST_REV_8_21_14_020_66_15]
MRRWVPYLLVLCVLLFAGGARAQDAISNTDLVKAFAGVALGSEHEKRVPRIIKWAAPVNVAVIGKGYPPLFEDLVTRQVADLAKETGHPMRLVYSEVMRREKRLPPDVSKIPINVLIFYGPKAELPAVIEKRTKGAYKAADAEKLLRLGFCHGRLRINKTGALTFGYAAVPAEITTTTQYGNVRVDPKIFLRACVTEEITQLMGLINDVKGLTFSIFSDDSRHVDLTEADRWMLRVLYDARMKPGMKADEALPLAAQILAIKRPGR